MRLQTAVRQLAGTDLSDDLSMALANVLSVDLDNMTCSVELIGGQTLATMNSVQLMARVDDGFLCVPAIDSTVIVIWSKRTEPAVVMYSQLQDVFVSADDKVTLQSDTYGGMVKVQDLVTKLNAVENKLNDMISIYNSHVHTDPQGGVTTSPLQPITGNITPTVRADIENTKVVHGD